MFEWDEMKEQKNIIKHEISFSFAASVFLDPYRDTMIDDRKDYGEVRYITNGYIQGRLFVVVHTLRNGKIRVISARKANDREVEQHEKLHSRPE